MVAGLVIKLHSTSVRLRLAQVGAITVTEKFNFEQPSKYRQFSGRRLCCMMYCSSTPLLWLPVLSNIEPPALRRKAATDKLVEKIVKHDSWPIQTLRCLQKEMATYRH